MSLNVISLFPLPERSRDWSKQELAEFYRVAASLVRSGVSVETDRGLSDEGDPWFVFSQVDTGDVIIHFARFDGDYIVASPALGKCVRGRDFRALIESLIESHPLVISTPVGGGGLFVHPAALLVVLVTTCFFKLYPSSAAAAEQTDHVPVAAGNALAKMGGSGSGNTAVVLDERAGATVLAAIAVAVAWVQSDNANLELLSAAPPSIAEFSAPADYIAADAPADAFGAFQAHRPYDGDSAAETAGALQVLSSDNPIRSPGASSGHPPADHNLIIGDFSTGASSTASPEAGGSFTGQSVALSFSDHVARLPILEVAASPATTAAVAGASTASLEASLAIGASFQAHIMTDLSGPEQKLVLDLAAQTPSNQDLTVGGTTDVSKGAMTTDVSSTTDANPTTTSNGATGPSASDHAAAAAVSTAKIVTTDASLTTSNAAAPPATASTPSVDGGASSLQGAETAIQQFVAVHPDFQIINDHNELIIYDPHLTPANLPLVTEQTFTFHDGSSVVLIGLSAAHGTAAHVSA